MKRILAVLLIVLLIAPSARADDPKGLYNSLAGLYGVPELKDEIEPNYYNCEETGILVGFSQNENGKPIGVFMTSQSTTTDDFIMTAVCLFLTIHPLADAVELYGNLLRLYVRCKMNQDKNYIAELEDGVYIMLQKDETGYTLATGVQ